MRGDPLTIERNDHGCTSHPKTDHKPSSRKLPDGIRTCLQNGANNKQETRTPDRPSTTKSVSSEASSDCAYQGTTTGQGGDHFLLIRGKGVAKRLVDRD